MEAAGRWMPSTGNRSNQGAGTCSGRCGRKKPTEAETEDQAYALAKDMDGGYFKQSNELGDWHINEVKEVTA